MTWSAKQTMLAKKTIKASAVRNEGRQMKTLIDAEKLKYTRTVHLRKEAILGEEKSAIASGMMSKKKKESMLKAMGVGDKPPSPVSLLNSDTQIQRQTKKFNEMKQQMRNSQSTGSLLHHRKEAERGVLKMAYMVRAQANQSDLPMPGMQTSRRIAKGNMRETIRQLKEKKDMDRTMMRQRPQTAGSGSMSGRSGGTMGGMFQNTIFRPDSRQISRPMSSRPMSAAAGATSSRGNSNMNTARSNQDTSPRNGGSFGGNFESTNLNARPASRTRQRPKTASSAVLASDSEVRGLVSTLNMERMLSTLSVNSDSVGPEGIVVKAIKIQTKTLPDEPMAERVNFETTHLHKLRMGYLTGNGYAFELDDTDGGSGKKKKRRPHTSKGRPPRPKWKYTGDQPAWRPTRIDNEPLPTKINCTGAKYPWVTQYPS
ncbi:hypothetical protein TL16_g08283 [Triparma laevis f. inornata]|uniref:Uncharacterized protein n=2 Tax=Triparma laevis TaxID=1534972 RepID=A0A9W7FTY9_9STRA|nr:hypothetical protein TL16_g08283 [Triparma laevis f. inornata]GMI18105.1 hypothetical protein TrLO_g1527 [Triparma laevis f. longispina]